ncbi:MAG: NAD-dependent DNA ligase LigA [Defluviitaleaceae bacterium]|nr:NAD-dependent DNA ligase LigA [Defluviitaleaceae bacterium]
MFYIRKTTNDDLDTVMDIYAYARKTMKESGNPDQWGDDHPPRATIEGDIRAGLSYVCESGGRVIAVFYFNIAADPTYTRIDGNWLDDTLPYGVVHRIARAEGAKGAGKACLEWCYALCGNIRIDTHKNNAPMIKLLEKSGYGYCGVIRLGLFDDPYLDERRAYQKISPVSRMKGLSEHLREASKAYYHENRELMTDREYDALYDELVRLESETGTVLANSPTQKVGYEVVSELKKVPHTVPMLSLDKTKDAQALAAFLGEETGLLTYKLDGLAVSLAYENGTLTQALTRGNGVIGEDVTHNARTFINLPLSVACKGSFTVRGEAVIPFSDFDAINAALPAEEAYKNPRNLCSGTVRQLNSEVAAARRVRFYAIGVSGFGIRDLGFGIRNSEFEIRNSESEIRNSKFEIQNLESGTDGLSFELKSAQLQWLADLGFEVVANKTVTADTVVAAVEDFKARTAEARVATDGLVLTIDNIAKGEAMGATSKFPRDSIAFKWADEVRETTLRAVEWNTSRTGLINPVAIFDTVELEGTSVSRASVHNVSILRELALGIGDCITVYKANMIIPQVAENLSRNTSGGGEQSRSLVMNAGTINSAFVCGEDAHRNSPSPLVPIPAFCPVCGGATEIVAGPSGEALYCVGTSCGAQRLQALAHFVSRNAFNIEGLSEQTLEKFISLGLVDTYPDLFDLARHEETIIDMEGFGRKSFDNIIKAVEAAKDIALPNFIYALGIRHVGLANAKLLCAHFSHDMEKIIGVCTSDDYAVQLNEIKHFGEAIAQSLHTYFSNGENLELIKKTLPLLRLKIPAHVNATTQAGGTVSAGVTADLPLSGLTFVITGEVIRYKNRKELQDFIESQGGKVTGSVTAKTSYLINNDAASTSGKNKKAAELGVPVLTEEGFTALYDNAIIRLE